MVPVSILEGANQRIVCPEPHLVEEEAVPGDEVRLIADGGLVIVGFRL